MPGLEEDVLRLDIAVHDVPVMRVLQGIRHLARDTQRVFDRKLPLMDQTTAQRLPLNVRHDIVRETIGFPGVVEWQDVWMGEPGGDLDLAEEAFRPEARSQLGAEHFERHRPAVFHILCQVDSRHAAAAELSCDRIAPGQACLEAVQQSVHSARYGGGQRRASVLDAVIVRRT